ncbi:MAG TPA: sigma-54 dependent transcriptional regulator [Ignavibacteriaceae bacterium]|nr:sigma-54 dependent transcriptional regulator [Ignavibacteriaceae bacterium]
MIKILIIDDEQEMLNSLNKLLSRNPGYEIRLIDDYGIALKTVCEESFNLIITDLKMKENSGLDILKSALGNFPGSKVIMISGYGTIETSVEAMRNGAFDFLEKPFTSRKLFDSVERALANGTVYEPGVDDELEEVTGLLYKSETMRKVIGYIKKIAPGNMNVLITGESGTGKELIARAIHTLSRRSRNAFVPVNCGALPEHLFESELFGHERGAFTGAVKTKPGLLEFANQGTFFFDEIGDMSLALQIKLLRMLEERKIRRVGAQNEISIDVRIIAATNKNLEKEVAEKRFREDLYYRLNTIRIDVPPLRERKEDIILLSKYFINDLCSRDDKPAPVFSREAEIALKNYFWPGNVREVQNIIGRAYFLSTNGIVERSDLPIPSTGEEINLDSSYLNPPYKEAKEKSLEKFEVEYLTYHLKINKGNITKTAEVCGLDRRSIHRLINKYNIIYQDEDNSN